MTPLPPGLGVTSATPIPSRRHVWLLRIGSMLWALVLIAALYGLSREWAGIHFHDLRAAFQQIGLRHIALALVFTVLSYFFNSTIGLLAHYWVGVPLRRPWRDAAVSFIYSAFSMNAGGTWLGGGSIRMRFAAAQEMAPSDIARLSIFVVVANWMGHAFLCGVLLLVVPFPLGWLPPNGARLIGAVLVSLSLILVLWRGGSKRWRNSRLSLPFATATLVVSVLDWLCAGLAMWALFPGPMPVAVFSFVLVVAISQAVSAVTQVPGGLGVLELGITKLLVGTVPSAALAGVLVTYRLVYYVLPFLTAALMLACREIWIRRTSLRVGARMAVHGWNTFAPRLGAMLALGGGFMLLLSANTPMEAARRRLLADLLPLPFVETSHFLSSLVGALLIVLAHGLRRRTSAAWWMTVILTAFGIVFSFVKGFDWEEALALSFLLTCLLPFRSQFYRKASIWSQRFTLEWWALLLALVLVATWVGFFTSRHVAYTNELWWQFSFYGDASRTLRALAAASCVFLIVALAQCLRRTRERRPSDQPTLPEIERVVSDSSSATSQLAFLGDKEFSFSKDGRCFLMYADQGRSRIVLGDPVGQSDEADDLLWTFIERARDEGMRPVFYQVSAKEMPRYVDMGFALFKLGEEACVPLNAFTLDGSNYKKLRQAQSRCQRSGCTFAIWDPPAVAENLEALRTVSDAWMADHRAEEKGFSVGQFTDDYIRRFSCAVVLSNLGTVVAFTNIWKTAGKEELSADLMRHIPDAPGGVMDYLFAELMLWGRVQGYGQFNLGMAPLSGFSTHPLAPLWNKVAAQIFRRGETFYHFRGLHDYKEKFHPRWEPRYLALPSSWSLSAALLDATSLIGHGVKGVFGKKNVQSKGDLLP